MTKRSADQAYKENTAAIQDAIQHLQAGLKQHAKEQEMDPRNHGFAGDAAHVLNLVQQAASFINNHEE